MENDYLKFYKKRKIKKNTFCININFFRTNKTFNNFNITMLACIMKYIFINFNNY